MKRDVRKEFSREELDQMRSVLADLVEGNREVADLFPAAPGAGKTSGKGNQYDAIREQIQNMSDKELTMLRSAMDPVSMQRKLARSRAVIANFKNTANTVGLPGIDSYCGAPVSTEAIIASDVVYFLAEAVRDIAQDGCNEVVVILGEGGNLRAACLITDAVYIIAKAVNQGIHFCDDDYAASVGQASYDRLGHIHDDLAASVANDDSNKSMIVNNDNTNKDTIVNNDNTNKDTIVNNDNTNKTTIVNNDNANTAALTLLINAALTQIIDNANANKNELKNLLLRTQIEADLASTDAAVLVALYQTPSTVCTTPSIPNPTTQCGLLDLVSAIVHETIVNQGNSASAQALWVQAEALKASQPKAAYATFRKAYKASSK
ncbi:MAG: hypothetical protein DMF63_02110 [Acidobacteria bacterium]|nr:MAG: hypothetical protein DMF63_02110 [Acidobacteriota bacterium]